MISNIKSENKGNILEQTQSMLFDKEKNPGKMKNFPRKDSFIFLIH